METRQLGRTGLMLSAISMGCSRLGSLRSAPPRIARNAIAAALDYGITAFDTADSYAQGDSEGLLGATLKGKRDRVVLSTKAGFVLPPAARFIRILKPALRPLCNRVTAVGAAAQNVRSKGYPRAFSPARLERCLEGSLRRLKTEYVDIFYLHGPQQEDTEDVVRFLETTRIVEQGKARAIGISPEDDTHLATWLAYPNVDVLQLPANPWSCPTHAETIQTASTAILGIIGRAPFAAGRWQALIGNPSTESRNSGLEAISQRTGLTPVQLAVAYSLRVKGLASVLVGLSRAEHVRALAGLPEAAKRLDEDDLSTIRAYAGTG